MGWASWISKLLGAKACNAPMGADEKATSMSSDSAEFSKRMVEHSYRARLGTLDFVDLRRRIEMLVKHNEPNAAVLVSQVRPVEPPSGSSSGTLFFEAKVDDVEYACVLRFAPREPLFHVYDLAGQVAIQRGLEGSGVLVPKQYWADIEGRYLGVASYVMERIAGERAAVAWPKDGVFVKASPETRRSMMMDLIHTLAKIHNVDWESRALSHLLGRSRGDRPIEREINWYWDALTWASADASLAQLSFIREWLIDNEPCLPKPVLCHGDANQTNYLFGDGHVVAALDWEMAFLGAPECDLTYMAMTLESSGLAFPEGAVSVNELFKTYEKASGHQLKNMEYFGLFTYFRAAVILTLGLRHKPAEFRPAYIEHARGMRMKLAERARAVGLNTSTLD
jgi:prepilin-type processing-associated H-X9-DG protein